MSNPKYFLVDAVAQVQSMATHLFVGPLITQVSDNKRWKSGIFLKKRKSNTIYVETKGKTALILA